MKQSDDDMGSAKKSWPSSTTKYKNEHFQSQKGNNIRKKSQKDNSNNLAEKTSSNGDNQYSYFSQYAQMPL